MTQVVFKIQLPVNLQLNALLVLTLTRISRRAGIKAPQMFCMSIYFYEHTFYITFPSWLYTLFLMIDGNFKLKLKDKGISDAFLGSGWAYFVNNEKFQAYLQDHADDDQPEVGGISLYMYTSDSISSFRLIPALQNTKLFLMPISIRRVI